MRITSAIQATATAIAAGTAFSVVRRLRGRMNLEGRSALITGGSRGLGLAIARELALALGGRIELDSELGRGSRFEFVLPAGPSGV